MTQGLLLATPNGAHVRIYNAPTPSGPHNLLIAPGTVLYDVTFTAPALASNQDDPMGGVTNCLHPLNVTLTPGMTYHIVIDFDSTSNYRATPSYATSYGLVPVSTGGYNGVTLYKLCAPPPPPPPAGSARPIDVPVTVGKTTYGTIHVTLVNGTMTAVFQTKDGKTLTQIETELGKDHLNWVQYAVGDTHSPYAGRLPPLSTCSSW